MVRMSLLILYSLAIRIITSSHGKAALSALCWIESDKRYAPTKAGRRYNKYRSARAVSIPMHVLPMALKRTNNKLIPKSTVYEIDARLDKRPLITFITLIMVALDIPRNIKSAKISIAKGIGESLGVK